MRYAARVSLHAPKVLQVLIRSKAGAPWRKELAANLARLQKVMEPRLDELGDAHLEPDAWERIWDRWPAHWKALIL